jgi:hypothetical protein
MIDDWVVPITLTPTSIQDTPWYGTATRRT